MMTKIIKNVQIINVANSEDWSLENDKEEEEKPQDDSAENDKEILTTDN
jgi:hypothetical protein